MPPWTGSPPRWSGGAPAPSPSGASGRMRLSLSTRKGSKAEGPVKREVPEGVQQQVIVVDYPDNYAQQAAEKERILIEHLRKVLGEAEGNKAMIFVLEREASDHLALRLWEQGFKAPLSTIEARMRFMAARPMVAKGYTGQFRLLVDEQCYRLTSIFKTACACVQRGFCVSCSGYQHVVVRPQNGRVPLCDGCNDLLDALPLRTLRAFVRMPAGGSTLG